MITMLSKESHLRGNTRKIFLIFTVFIVLLVITGCGKKEVDSELEAECNSGERAPCTNSEGYTGYMSCDNGALSSECFIINLDDCPVPENDLFNICCKNKGDSLFDCNEKTEYSPGDFVIIKVNLQKAMGS